MSDPINHLLDTAAIVRYHRLRMQEHGADSVAALGWARPEGQQARFAALAGIADLTDCAVLDVGCGHADLYPFLQQRFAGVRYCGIEQLPELLDVAQARHGADRHVTLGGGDFLRASLPPADYVLASGALSYRHRNPDFIWRAIERLYGACRLGLGFNLLSQAPGPDGLLVAYEPAEIVAFCQTLAARVALVQGYWPDDFTVFVYRG
ncbi:class I SAM-dependent methyltransferase [Hymenobacter ruricola]|uniref:Class I SAM-dependent methyltransferase n=1 Tax=Hymenobacter ruricola TaxID=2791023 RepID=A0ABS0I6V8_9BACT|nr:class I SAM-dependent methyltransferase [Hymenobacter ruricola]MBF9222680.1 class I SAM-dependent methyltransferase [Hymenobacter ruricola]